MARDKKISGSGRGAVNPASTEEDEKLFASLRPETLEEYVGQQQVVEPVRIAIQAAKMRAEPLDHLLLYGPPGLGKTTLAYIIRKEMEGDLHLTSGPALKRAADLVGYLTGLKRGDVLFIDEIHRLDAAIEERLYSAMEDFKLDLVVDRGPNARTLQYPLKQFTLVGATTMAGMLSAPLRDRFGLVYHLQFYSAEELTRIVRRSAQILGVELQDEGGVEIARRSRGTPRIANRLLRRVRDYAMVKGDGVISREMADGALKLERIDELGLDQLDRRLLHVILTTYNGGPVGIEALAATLNEQASTLQEVVEPYLLQIGFLARTPTGRRITDAGIRHLGGDPRPPLQPRLLS
jgi:holliday junction DNA helicase RuvB